MPLTPTLVLCDQLVAALEAAWAPVAPSGAERAYFKRIGDASSKEDKLAGRRVVIYPTDYDTAPATRGADDFTHNVTVQVFERYEDGGDPSREWIDERVDFVYGAIFEGFDFTRQPPEWNPMLTTVSRAVSVLDVSRLLGAGNLFVSVVEFVFLETRDA